MGNETDFIQDSLQVGFLGLLSLIFFTVHGSGSNI
jgi:hypothetical protein